MVALTAGQRHERPHAIPLLEQATERKWPEAVAGDKGYSASDLRNWLQEREIEAVIPYREDELGDHDYDCEASRERPMIERTITRLNRYRRIATRYDKLASSYLTMVTIACMLERHLNPPLDASHPNYNRAGWGVHIAAGCLKTVSSADRAPARTLAAALAPLAPGLVSVSGQAIPGRRPGTDQDPPGR